MTRGAHVNKDALARRRVFSGHASMTSSDEPPAYFISRAHLRLLQCQLASISGSAVSQLEQKQRRSNVRSPVQH